MDICANKTELRKQQAQELANAVRERRRTLGMSQKALGLRAGVGIAFIYYLEAGEPAIRLDSLLAVLDVLGLQMVIETVG